MRSFNDNFDVFGSDNPMAARGDEGRDQPRGRRGGRAPWTRGPGAIAMGRGGRPGGFDPRNGGPGAAGFGAPSFGPGESDSDGFGPAGFGNGAPAGFGERDAHDFGDDSRRGFGGRRGGREGGHPGRGFGGEGFGPQGAGFGPGFGFGGPMGPGGRGHGGRGPGRGRKGDVRNAILALLAEKAMNGYQLISAISEKSEGLWSPSAGSVYPALNLLTDEGLIHEVQVDGKKASALTDAGREYVEQHADELSAPWQRVAQPHKGFLDIRPEVGQLSMAVQQVVMQGDQGQIEAVRGILDRARKDIYRLLAGDTSTDADGVGAQQPTGE